MIGGSRKKPLLPLRAEAAEGAAREFEYAKEGAEQDFSKPHPRARDGASWRAPTNARSKCMS